MQAIRIRQTILNSWDNFSFRCHRRWEENIVKDMHTDVRVYFDHPWRCYMHITVGSARPVWSRLCNCRGKNWQKLKKNFSLNQISTGSVIICRNQKNPVYEQSNSEISESMQLSGNWPSCYAILVWNDAFDFKSDSDCTLIQFKITHIIQIKMFISPSSLFCLMKIDGHFFCLFFYSFAR